MKDMLPNHHYLHMLTRLTGEKGPCLYGLSDVLEKETLINEWKRVYFEKKILKGLEKGVNY